MKQIHIETPTIRSSSLTQLVGIDTFLKLENCQPSGSFKLRGIGALCAEASRNGAKALVSSSGGNAGLAAAFAARMLKMPLKVFVPESTPQFMRERIGAEGAAVVVRGKIWDEAHAAALEEVKRSDGFYIPPFDHPTIWKGNSILVDEVKRQIEKPGLITVAVGGGGLLLGVLEGLKRNGWDDVPVLACETEGTASFAATFAQKKLVTLPTITGVATSLGARTVASKLLEWINVHPIQSAVVTDAEATQASLRFLEDHRFLVEPACGAALAPLYFSKQTKQLNGPVLAIVCGGAVVNLEKLRSWQNE